MANSGYAISDVQGQVEALLDNAGEETGTPPLKLNESEVTHKGQTFQAMDALEQLLETQLQEDSYDISQTAPDDNMANAGTLVTKFYNNYNKLASSGALNNPAVGKVVTQLSSDIMAVTGDFKEVVNGETGNHFYNLSSFHNELAASSLSKRNSDGICAAGNGTAQGLSCQ